MMMAAEQVRARGGPEMGGKERKRKGTRRWWEFGYYIPGWPVPDTLWTVRRG